jgi:transcriptional regulator with XRE-family HTH domain
MILPQAFGMVLRTARNKAKLTQEELAHRCNLDRTFVSLLERGLRQPSLTTLFAVAEVVGIPPQDLVAETQQLMANKKEGSNEDR